MKVTMRLHYQSKVGEHFATYYDAVISTSILIKSK